MESKEAPTADDYAKAVSALAWSICISRELAEGVSELSGKPLKHVCRVAGKRAKHRYLLLTPEEVEGMVNDFMSAVVVVPANEEEPNEQPD